MSRVDYGIVEVEIGGETYTLSPTIDCSRKMKRFGLGSPRKVLELLQDMDADDMAMVVAAGAGLGQKQLEPLAKAIHDDGTIHHAAKLIEFVVTLMNPTGKEPDLDAQEGEPEGE